MFDNVGCVDGERPGADAFAPEYSSNSEMTADEMQESPPKRWRGSGGVWLGLWSCVIAAVWLLLLPWVARQPETAAYLERLDAQGIDPSAMYYTELDAMKPILERLK